MNPSSDGADVRAWLRQLRVHQYVKNSLVFVPILTAHAFTTSALWAGGLAFAAFCLCASAGYIINDVVDLEADRRHPTKWARPMASGNIRPSHALGVAVVLIGVALTLAAAISLSFLLILGAYLSFSTLYTLWLKRHLLIDVIVLALLYSLRVVGGAAAIDVALSEWLLAFSMMIFASFALIKRFVELANRQASGAAEPNNRDYAMGDISVIGALAAAAGFNSITVFALYVSSDASRLYSRPQLLWLICPILFFWMGRALILAHRRMMDEDPVTFVLKDWVSLASIVAMVALTLAAI